MFKVGETVFVVLAKKGNEDIKEGKFVEASVIQVNARGNGLYSYEAIAKESGNICRYTPASTPYKFYSKEDLLKVLDESLKEVQAKEKCLRELYQKYQS